MVNARYQILIFCTNSSSEYWFSTSPEVHSGEIPSSDYSSKSLRPFFFFWHFLHILSSFDIFSVLWTEGLELYSKHFCNQGIKSSDCVPWNYQFGFWKSLFLNGRLGLCSRQADPLSLPVLWSSLAATGRLIGSSEKIRRDVKGKDPLSFFSTQRRYFRSMLGIRITFLFRHTLK